MDSFPDLKIGTILAVFSSTGNIPVLKEKRPICAGGRLLLFSKVLLIEGLCSSLPAALSLQFDMILSTSA